MVAMAQVILAETDQPLKRLINKVLSVAGYTVIQVSTRDSLWQHVAGSPDPCVIVLGDRLVAWSDDVIHATMRDIESAGVRHAIVLLTATPENMSTETCMLLWRSQVAVVPLPFELDRFIATINWAATYVLHLRPSDRDTSDPAPMTRTFNPEAQPYEPPSPAVPGGELPRLAWLGIRQHQKNPPSALPREANQDNPGQDR